MPPSRSSRAGGTRALIRYPAAGMATMTRSPSRVPDSRRTTCALGAGPQAPASNPSSREGQTALLREQRTNAPFPDLVGGIVEMELARALISDLSALVDQDEAGPVPDVVAVPGSVVVVLGVGIGNAVLRQGAGHVSLVMLPGIGRKLRGVDPDQREALGAVPPVELDQRGDRPGAVATGEHPEIEKDDLPAKLIEPYSGVRVEPARVVPG